MRKDSQFTAIKSLNKCSFSNTKNIFEIYGSNHHKKFNGGRGEGLGTKRIHIRDAFQIIAATLAAKGDI